MRTTVDIPDPLYRELKSRAALRGCSVKELILRGVRAELKSQPGSESRSRIEFPLIKSKRKTPLKLTNRQINELLFP